MVKTEFVKWSNSFQNTNLLCQKEKSKEWSPFWSVAVAFTVKGKIACIKTIYQSRIVGNWEEKMAKQGKFPMDADLKHKNDRSEINEI